MSCFGQFLHREPTGVLLEANFFETHFFETHCRVVSIRRNDWLVVPCLGSHDAA
jgi:hypothetical protein